jgi:hypothetical protein
VRGRQTAECQPCTLIRGARVARSVQKPCLQVETKQEDVCYTFFRYSGVVQLVARQPLELVILVRVQAPELIPRETLARVRFPFSSGGARRIPARYSLPPWLATCASARHSLRVAANANELIQTHAAISSQTLDRKRCLSRTVNLLSFPRTPFGFRHPCCRRKPPIAVEPRPAMPECQAICNPLAINCQRNARTNLHRLIAAIRVDGITCTTRTDTLVYPAA